MKEIHASKDGVFRAKQAPYPTSLLGEWGGWEDDDEEFI